MATLKNGLKTIELGSINWRTLFNDNMQKLDISTINFVLYADLPTTFVGDRMFFATDKMKFYYDDGTQLLEVIGGIIKGLDADKLTNTEDKDLYYATDTNVIWYNDNGTMVSVTGSVDLSAVDQNIIPDVNWSREIGSSTNTWGRGYFTYIYADRIYAKSGGDLEINPGTGYNILLNGNGRGVIGADTTFNPTGSFSVSSAGLVSLNSSVSVDLKTGTVTRLSVTTDSINISNFTQLGDLAPQIKTKVISHNTLTDAGGTRLIEHNLDSSKIISFTCVLRPDTNSLEGISPNYSVDPDREYGVRYDDTYFRVKTHDTNSNLILDKPFDIYITYEL